MSFKRRETALESGPSSGTRSSPSTSSVRNVSTGIPSLDDILGGGIPLSSDILILTSDPHAAYGDVVQKYFIAQGIASSQRVCVLSDSGRGIDLVRQCMWLSSSQALLDTEDQENDDDKLTRPNQTRIAWRYKNLGNFKTTVESSRTHDDDYCKSFDLKIRIPDTVINEALDAERLVLLDQCYDTEEDPFLSIIVAISKLRDKYPEDILRVSIITSSSSLWTKMSPVRMFTLLYGLRALLRSSCNVCLSITLPHYMCSDSWGGEGWAEKLACVTDGCLKLDSFRGDPYMSSKFTSHQGLLKIYRLPSLYTIVPPSDRFSVLRGLFSSKELSSTGGFGENNIAFRLTRRKLVFETLHLDIEGGLSERRTVPGAEQQPYNSPNDYASASQSSSKGTTNTSSLSTLEIAIEDDINHEIGRQAKDSSKRRVAFRESRPNVYDF